MPPVAPSVTNVHQAMVQARLQVAYSRNPLGFPINRWARVVPIDRSPAVYYRLDNAEGYRVPEGKFEQFLWADGKPRPQLLTMKHEKIPFVTKRYSFGGDEGTKLINMADYSVIENYNRGSSVQAMTNRAGLCQNMVLDTGEWPAGNSGTATAVGGGLWLGSTPSDQFIENTFDAANLIIDSGTGGLQAGFKKVAVMGPKTAQTVKASEEIKQYITQNPVAYPVMQGAAELVNRWGLPWYMFGFETVVDNTVVNIAEKGAADNLVYLFDDPDLDGTAEGYVAFLTVPDTMAQQEIFRGGPITPAMGQNELAVPPDFSTVTIAALEDMTFESEVDGFNRIQKMGVADDIVPLLTAPATGFLCTNTLAA